MKTAMKIGFLGTPEISAYVLEELYKKGFDIGWVVTQPDRRSGRGQKLGPPPVKERAISLGLPVLQCREFNRSFFEEVKKVSEIDLAIVIAYGLYIPSYFINHPKYSCLNIHFSLLPKYRGAAPVARAIMNGETHTGVTIMEIGREMDAGDIVAQVSIPIKPEDTTESLTWKLVKEGARLLIETIGPYTQGDIKPTPQDQTGTQPSYAEKLLAEERVIDWNQDAIGIHNKVRALYPWPVAQSRVNDLDIKFITTKPIDFVKDVTEKIEPGIVMDVNKKKGFFIVKTLKGALLVEKVQPFGKKEMSVSEFLNGYSIERGIRFR